MLKTFLIVLGFAFTASYAYGYCQVDRDCHEGYECDATTNSCVYTGSGPSQPPVFQCPQVSCVRYCSNWGSNGNCHGYDEYCGVQPYCVTECTNVGDNGNCHGRTDFCYENRPSGC